MNTNTPSDGGYLERFICYDIALERDVLLVGIPYERIDANSLKSDSAYVFQYNDMGWVQEQKIIAHPGLRDQLMG